MRSKSYKSWEITYLRDNYRFLTNKEIGKHFNRSAASVRKKRHALGLNRTPMELKRIFQRNSNLFKKAEPGTLEGRTKVVIDSRTTLYIKPGRSISETIDTYKKLL